MPHITEILPYFDNRHYCKPWPRDVTDDDVVTACILDTETTGLQAGVDRIVEIAILPFSFLKKTGELLIVGEPVVQLQDPGFALPSSTTSVNGITDEMLKGKEIDWAVVANELKSAALVIAHNAAFDRAFVDRELNRAKQDSRHVWGCSYDMLEWDAPVNKQEVLLAWYCGLLYEAHRAEADIHALLHLLHTQRRLPELYRRAYTTDFELICHTDYLKPFNKDNNTALKDLGFRFDGNTKTWGRTALSGQEEIDGIIHHLRTAGPVAFRGVPADRLFQVRTVIPTSRYGIGA